MPLSDREQRLFEEIEQALIADDPRFASTGCGGRSKALSRIPVALSVIAALIGLGCVVFGLITGTVLGASIATAGFVLIVASCWAAIVTRRRR